MNVDDSFSGYMDDISESVHRGFTEIQLLRQTNVHQLYRAKRLGRWYLLKALAPDLRGSDFHRQMLLKEMQVLMQLNHPNIVGCLGIESVDDYADSHGSSISVGECLVLEYVDGLTLREFVSKDSPATEQVYEAIVSELLEALAYMHACGITHRDLKPDNIMIAHNGNHVKLIDFSLADTDSHAILKQPSGTKGYISPEQSQATTPDARNDIYSLGVVISQLPLHGFWTDISKRCQQPIGQRYQNIEAIQTEIAHCRRKASRRRLMLILLPALIGFLLLGLLLWYSLTSRQDSLYEKFNRMPQITEQALQKLDQQMAATNLARHMDTIAHWRYLDPQINEKILAVNAFAYDYAADSLPGLTDDERMQVLRQMLDHWQQWHNNIVRRAKYLISNDGNYVTHYAEQSVVPASSSIGK